MANTQINVTTNGTTTLATAGKYCDRDIDVNVNVAGGGAQPTQFTNLYTTENVTVKSNLGSQTIGEAVAMETYNYGNVLKIKYSHAANESVILRMRGIGTVRDRFQCVISDASDMVITWIQLSAANALTYDEHGDACLTLSSVLMTKAWENLYFVFQYPGINSNVTDAKAGPIVTINEPIGNGGHAG